MLCLPTYRCNSGNECNLSYICAYWKVFDLILGTPHTWIAPQHGSFKLTFFDHNLTFPVVYLVNLGSQSKFRKQHWANSSTPHLWSLLNQRLFPQSPILCCLHYWEILSVSYLKTLKNEHVWYSNSHILSARLGRSPKSVFFKCIKLRVTN